MIRWLLARIFGREMVYGEDALESVTAAMSEVMA